ncbi:MAG: type I secretion system permease/ATPase [Dechloromonas sp.]|nr:type I secretion system permease/ATPase [Dechloromonas sp.]
MKALLRPYRYVVILAAGISFFLNLLLLAPTFYMMQIFDRVFMSRSLDTLGWLSFIVLLMLLFYLAVDWLRGRMMTSAALLCDRLLGERVLRVVLDDAVQPGFGRHGFLMRDVAAIRRIIAGNGLSALLDSPWLPVMLLLIFLFHPVLGLLAFVCSAALVILAVLNNRVSQKPVEDLQMVSRKASGYIDSSLRNAEVVRAMGMFPALAQRWDAINHQALRHQHESGRISALVSGLSRFSRQIVQVIMVGAGAYLVVGQNATPGIMLATTLILGRALAPVEHLIASWKDILEARAAYRRLEEAFAQSAHQAPRTRLPELKGALEADRVVYALAPNSPPLVKGVSFALAAGEFLGIIGASGSGKSSLLRLLTGTWRPQAGSVRYDNAEIAQWLPEELGRQIGYLPQDIELFPGTVSDNIARMGVPDSEAVVTAAHRAGVHDMILRLPQGYDTEIGPGGAALSGGQRQRIALARALYGGPRLLLLDEPNSNLDAEGETLLQQILGQLKAEGVTLVVVTHRRSLVAASDKLLVLREGAVALYGPSREVVEKLSGGGAA